MVPARFRESVFVFRQPLAAAARQVNVDRVEPGHVARRNADQPGQRIREQPRYRFRVGCRFVVAVFARRPLVMQPQRENRQAKRRQAERES